MLEYKKCLTLNAIYINKKGEKEHEKHNKGNSSDGSTAFVYGASYTREVCPWKRTGVINGVSVKKIVILEETGITTIGATSLSYARYCEEIVLPSSVTKIQGYEPMVGNLSLKTVSFAGASDAGEGGI